MSLEECNALTLDQLKEELTARNLDGTGLKTAMVDRLIAALDQEKAEAAAAAEQRAAAAALAAQEAANQPCKLFVGQVPQVTSEQQVRDLFGSYGTVQEVQFMKDRNTQQPKGCCFVVFANEEQANLAIENIHEKVTLPGAKRSVIVNKHASKTEKGDNKLYVGMLSRSTSEEEVRAMFEAYGAINEIFMMTDKQTGQSKGQCFVKYVNKADASRAITALHDNFKDKDAPSNIQVRFAHSPDEKNRQQNMQMFGGGMGMGQGFGGLGGMGGMAGMGGMGGMGALGGNLAQGFGQAGFGFDSLNPYAPVAGFGAPKPVTSKTMQTKGPAGANLFVLGIPETYGDVDLGNLFSNFGNVISSKVQVDLQVGHSKGFGFVSFDNAASAQAAITSMDGFMLGAKRLQVRVKKNDGGQSSTGYRPY